MKRILYVLSLLLTILPTEAANIVNHSKANIEIEKIELYGSKDKIPLLILGPGNSYNNENIAQFSAKIPTGGHDIITCRNYLNFDFEQLGRDSIVTFKEVDSEIIAERFDIIHAWIYK